MAIRSFIAVGSLALLCCAPVVAEEAVDATFVRDEPAAGVMTLTEVGAEWRVGWRAGGLPNGGATAADCELVAQGAQDADGVISARLIPFEGELNTLSAADIDADSPIIEVSVGPEGAFVTDGGAAAALCGLGSDIDGFYRRTETAD